MKDLISLINDGTINRNRVVFGNLTLYFSYETIVAFEKNDKAICRENEWGTTTGKYLNNIEPNKKLRVDKEEFDVKLAHAIEDELLDLKNTLGINACSLLK